MLFGPLVVAILVFTDVTAHVTSRVYPGGEPNMSRPMISHVSSYTCDANPYVNGCSIPMRSYRRIFQSECNRHDICYSCGSEYGISRRSCDRIFGQSIAERCGSAVYENMCRMLTYVSYAGVRLRGSPGYSRVSPAWCSDTWVSSCLFVIY